MSARAWRSARASVFVSVGLLLVYQEVRIAHDLGATLGGTGLLDRLLIPSAALGLALILRGVLSWLVLGMTATALSLVLVGNHACLDYFDRPLSFHQGSAAGQLWDARHSVAALVGIDGMLLLFAAMALPTVGWLLQRAGRARGTLTGEGKRQRRLGLALLLVSAAGLTWDWVAVGSKQDAKTLTRRHGALVQHLIQLRDLSSHDSQLFSGTQQRESIETILAHKALMNRTRSPFFGLAKGRNVILIQLESFEHFLLDLRLPGGEVIPNLNRLAAGGLRWQGLLNLVMSGRSSDAEFSAMTGLLAHPTDIVALTHFDQEWITLPKELKSYGYKTLSLCAFRPEFWNRIRAHPSYGIDDMRFVDSFRPGRNIGWGLCDVGFFAQAAAMLAKVESPYLALHITLTSHHPFSAVPEEVLRWPVGAVDSNMVAGYLRLTHYTDDALGKWLTAMQASGQLQNSIIVAYGDHNAGFTRHARAALGKITGRDHGHHESDRVFLMVAIPGEEEFIREHRDEFAKVLGGPLDLAPTVLHLLGLPIPIGFYGTHLFVGPEQRDPLLLPNGRGFVNRGQVVPLAEIGGPKGLPATDQELLKLQPEVARILIEGGGQAQVRTMRGLEDAALSRLAARPWWLEQRPDTVQHGEGLLAVFPLVPVPEGDLLQTVRGAEKLGGIPPHYVARGGGITRGLPVTNSLDALQGSANAGYRLIEVDMSWTTDGELVLLADWQESQARLFRGDPGPMDLAQFRASQSRHGLTHLTLDELVPWLDSHPAVRIITDIPSDTLRGLAQIQTRLARHRDRFIPQISRTEDYAGAHQLGFDRIILALDDASPSDDEVLVFTAQHPVYGIAMPVGRARGTLPRTLGQRGVFTYAYTVNSRFLWMNLRANGVDGVYTDELGLGREEATAPPDLPDWRVVRSGSVALGYRLVPFIPPPRFHWEFGPELEIDNPTQAPYTVELRAQDSDGELRDSRKIDLPARSSTRVWLRQLFLTDWGGLAMHGVRGHSTTKVYWGIEERSRFELVTADHAHTKFLLEGPTTGVVGYAVIIVNPLRTAAKVTLERSIIGGSVDKVLVIPPGSRVIRAWQVQPKQDRIRVTVEGDPVAVQSLRWDPLLRTMR